MTSLGGAFNEQLLWGRLPSIFELFAQEAMATSLQPAVEYIIKVIGHVTILLLTTHIGVYSQLSRHSGVGVAHKT